MDRKNPFYEEPIHKAFYYPSSPQDFSKQVKTKSSLQAELLRQEQQQSDSLASPDRRFVKGGNRFTAHLVTTDAMWNGQDQEKFNESWPDSERPSSLSIPEISEVSPISHDDPLEKLQQHKRWLADFVGKDGKEMSASMEGIPQKKDGESESTLRKYIERFRHGTPMSREERQKKAVTKREDFWWTQKQKAPSSSSVQPSESSTPKDEQAKTRSRLTRKLVDKEKEKKSEPLPSYPSCNPWADEQTRLLQARAEHALEKSAVSSQLSTEPAVSTDGLGSTGSTSTFSALPDEKPYRPSFIRNANKENFGPLTEYSHQGEDILQQWRLRRKMEQARGTAQTAGGKGDAAQPATELNQEVESKLAAFKQRLKQSSQVHFTPAPQSALPAHPSTGEQKVPSSHAQIASPHLISTPADTVNPHLHLSCDILPCPQHPVNPAVPQTYPAVPQTYPAVPQTHTAVPQTHPAVPQTHPAVPQTHTAVPQTHPAVPQTHPATPQTHTAVPQTHPAVPQTHPAIPQTHPAVASADMPPQQPSHPVSDVVSHVSGEPILTPSAHVLSKPPSSEHPSTSKRPNGGHVGSSQTAHSGVSDEGDLSSTQGTDLPESNTDSNLSGTNKKTTDTRPSSQDQGADFLSKGSLKSSSGESYPSQTSIEVPCVPQKSSASPSRSRGKVAGYPSYESDRLSFDPDISDRLLPHVAPFCQDSDSSFEKVKIKQIKALQREKKAKAKPVESRSSPVISEPIQTGRKLSKKDPRRSKSDSKLKDTKRDKGKRALNEKREGEESRRNLALHSSPKSGLKDTIGQVIGEHLFLPSDSVISSIESHASPYAHRDHTSKGNETMPETLPETVPETVPETQPESPPTHDDWGKVASSDSEDFADDDILRDLRHRRSVYLMKLRAIDTLLGGTS